MTAGSVAFQHVQQYFEAKAHYIGAGVGALGGVAANVTGLSSSANNVLLVIVCSIGGGLAARLPQLLAIFYKKQIDDRQFLTSEYRSQITELRAMVDKHEKIVQAHVNCRHDFQQALTAAYFRLDHLNECLADHNLSAGQAIKRFDGDSRISALDDELREIKGMPRKRGGEEGR